MAALRTAKCSSTSCTLASNTFTKSIDYSHTFLLSDLAAPMTPGSAADLSAPEDLRASVDLGRSPADLAPACVPTGGDCTYHDASIAAVATNMLACNAMKRSVATLMLIAAFGGHANAAARSVTVIGTDGARSDRFVDQLDEYLSDLYQVIPGEVYQRTLNRLDASGATADELQGVAARLRIDAIVGVSLAGEGGARKLLVTVRAGASGRLVARGQYDVTGRPVGAVCQRVLGDLVRALDRIIPVAKRSVVPATTDTIPAVHAQPAPVKRAPSPRSKESDDDDDESEARAPSSASPPPRSGDD
jgi:hypothetical protein